MASCVTTSKSQILETATQKMEADGISPQEATEEQWEKYLNLALEEHTSDPIQAILNVTAPQIAAIYGLAATLLGLVTGRGRQNFKNVFTRKTGIKSSFASLGSIYLGLHTPEEVKNARVSA